MNTKAQKQRFLLISIIPQRLSDQEALRDLTELKSLVEAYGGEVADLVVQRREVHDKGNYIGDGKIREASIHIKKHKINIVILNAAVKPGQIYDIKKVFQKSSPNIEVWDRVDLILQIFARHAHTAEARLQIDLAAMRHMGPRIYGTGMELSRQTGGIGTRGIGETNTERMKRHWRAQMKKAKDKLIKLSSDRQRQLDKRKKSGLKTVSLIGYTNAGKTTLFNYLTKKENYAENLLFATLDSAVGKVYLPKIQEEVYVTDTIGFIRNLPPSLIDAFKSTLMESIFADILLHVIDASDEGMHQKIRVVENILFDLGIADRERIYIFNKIDANDEIDKDALSKQYAKYSPQFISVKKEMGIEGLLTAIDESFLHMRENTVSVISDEVEKRDYAV